MADFWTPSEPETENPEIPFTCKLIESFRIPSQQLYGPTFFLLGFILGKRNLGQQQQNKNRTRVHLIEPESGISQKFPFNYKLLNSNFRFLSTKLTLNSNFFFKA